MDLGRERRKWLSAMVWVMKKGIDVEKLLGSRVMGGSCISHDRNPFIRGLRWHPVGSVLSCEQPHAYGVRLASPRTWGQQADEKEGEKAEVHSALCGGWVSTEEREKIFNRDKARKGSLERH